MFKKAGGKDNDRLSYLQQLVNEFQDTHSQECKEQVLANLANFAYDSANNSFLQQLNVIELFIDELGNDNEKIVEFAVGGLCNCALDSRNKDIIVRRNGIPSIIGCLSSSTEETVLSAITALMFLITPETKQDITTLPTINLMLQFSNSQNSRLSNLAKIFLHDFCTEDVIRSAKDTPTLN